MYLSRVLLKPGRLDNAWEWHRALWTLFPGIERSQNESAPFLFRIESMNLASGATVLMRSKTTPLNQSEKAKIVAAKTVDQNLQKGQFLHFVVTANVTKAIRDKDEPNRKVRVPLIREDDKKNWLSRKLNNSSVTDLDRISIHNHPPIYFRKGRRPGKIVMTTFEGIIQVEQTALLESILVAGIGPAKAFGCGLLLLARS